GGIAVPLVGEVGRADAVVHLGPDARPLGGTSLDNGARGTGPVLEDEVALPGELQTGPDQRQRVFRVPAGAGHLAFDRRECASEDLVADVPVQDLNGHGCSFLVVSRVGVQAEGFFLRFEGASCCADGSSRGGWCWLRARGAGFFLASFFAVC